MQEFVFSTSEIAIYEIATFVKQFAVKKVLSVNVSTSCDTIHVEFNRNVSYKVFSDFILCISTECFERKVLFNVHSVLFID